MGGSMGRGMKIAEWIFPLVPPSYDESHPWLVQFPVEKAGMDAPALLLGRDLLRKHELRSLGSKVSICAIYFHSNGCDIGQCVDDMLTIRDGALGGDAVVLCPEYPGYGLLQDFEPSVSGINLVARAAWEYCIRDLGFQEQQVMIWGRSIGSGPATFLAHALATEAKEAEKHRDPLTERFQTEPQVTQVCATSSSDWPKAAEPDVGAGPELVEVVVGMEVVVIRHLRSDSSSRSELVVGQRGLVVRVDEHGDALIDFQHLPKSQWVFRYNFLKFRFSYPKRPVCALVLIAPLTSVADVIRHHTNSEFAAALAGPMWEVLNMASSPVMESVPLLVVHPKADEIVPSKHGQNIFEDSTSRQKLGVWLRKASHNVALEDDHLQIGQGFLKEVIASCPTLQPVAQAVAAGGKSPKPSWHRDDEDAALLEAAERLLDLGMFGKAEEAVVLSL